jgi:hypothetical protein
MKIGIIKRWDWEIILISHIGRETTGATFQVRHKLYYLKAKEEIWKFKYFTM